MEGDYEDYGLTEEEEEELDYMIYKDDLHDRWTVQGPISKVVDAKNQLDTAVAELHGVYLAKRALDNALIELKKVYYLIDYASDGYLQELRDTGLIENVPEKCTARRLVEC